MIMEKLTMEEFRAQLFEEIVEKVKSERKLYQLLTTDHGNNTESFSSC
jgi:hypothetical protein